MLVVTTTTGSGQPRCDGESRVRASGKRRGRREAERGGERRAKQALTPNRKRRHWAEMVMMVVVVVGAADGEEERIFSIRLKQTADRDFGRCNGDNRGAQATK